MVANDNRAAFDVDALGRVYLLRPNGSRGMLVSQHINETDFHDVLRTPSSPLQVSQAIREEHKTTRHEPNKEGQ